MGCVRFYSSIRKHLEPVIYRSCKEVADVDGLYQDYCSSRMHAILLLTSDEENVG